MVETLTNPTNLLTIFVAVVCFATIVTIATPMMNRRGLEARLKSVSTRREELRRLHGRVIDSDGAEIAKLSIDFPTGLDGPVTPTVVLRLPRGRYAVDLRLAAEGPREASRAVALTVEEEGFRRIDLGR